MQADSMRAEGKMYCDSAVLAQAYTALHAWRDIYPTDYAHACYHYGRLLREKDDPVGAMQVFINATHSRTRDNHILGRVYSNMGSICHLANEFPLSYAMYEKSADCFLKNGDTINYYYALNDMAYELAEQGKKEETLFLLDTIVNNCSDANIIALTWETKAILYREIAKYDSSIYCANNYRKLSTPNSSIFTIIAQSYEKSCQIDSAIAYANMVLADSRASYQDRFNAIYIVSRDSTLCAKDVSAFASQREDIRYFEYEPQKEKRLQSIQLLEQDINCKTDWKWFYAIIATLLIIGIGESSYIYKKRNRHQLLSQQISDLEDKDKKIKAQIYKQVDENCSLFAASANMKKDLCWNNYDELCHIIDQHFNLLASKLRNKYDLNETETRLCVLVLLDLNRNQIAKILPYAYSGVGKLKYRVAQKLGTSGEKLRKHLIYLATNDA